MQRLPYFFKKNACGSRHIHFPADFRPTLGFLSVVRQQLTNFLASIFLFNVEKRAFNHFQCLWHNTLGSQGWGNLAFTGKAQWSVLPMEIFF